MGGQTEPGRYAAALWAREVATRRQVLTTPAPRRSTLGTALCRPTGPHALKGRLEFRRHVVWNASQHHA
eukprot:CAMPEP_0117498684 /NCGR_PEP_ID=MMETSP0784-20121206/21842_1 /TAXON_ID=39447 /ORGANISM="" /LENGTH=68 /DNA_ID=CAMNT_0005293779 /DNA_START=23 /DNA_END=226 /DNA_ORIENTATION=+